MPHMDNLPKVASIKLAAFSNRMIYVTLPLQ